MVVKSGFDNMHFEIHIYIVTIRENGLFASEIYAWTRGHWENTYLNFHCMSKHILINQKFEIHAWTRDRWKNTYPNSYCMLKHTLTNQKFEIYVQSLEVNANSNFDLNYVN